MIFTACASGGSGVSKTEFDWLEDRTVMVLNAQESGGGSGTIINSTTNDAYILTNAHVCRGIVTGGVIVTSKAKYPVYAIIFSETHDLCLIDIKAPDLNIHTDFASSAPDIGEKITISGHPFLRPHTTTSGNLSGPQEISMMTSIKPCIPADFKLNALVCNTLGGMPQFTKYQSMTTDAIIAPGSSGSAVYNENNKIVALVFAGVGRSFSQASLVPWEYIVDFSKQNINWILVSEKSASVTPETEDTETTINSFESINDISTPMVYSTAYDRIFETLKKIKESIKVK